MKISKNQMSIFECAIETAAKCKYLSGRHQLDLFDMMVWALGVKPNRSILKQAHMMIKEGRTAEEIGEFVLGDYEIPERTSPSRLNKVQYRLLQYIVYTFRRLLRQRDEGWVDSFLMMRAGFYCNAMIDGIAPGGSDTDTLIRMLKDGSTDEEIMKWYIGDFEVI